MRSVTLWLPDVGTDLAKRELQGKKIFGSVFCMEHKTGVMVVRPAGEGIDVECVMQLLSDMANKIAKEAAS